MSVIALYDPQAKGFRVVALDFPDHQDFVQESELVPIEGNPVGLSFTTRQPVLHRQIDLEKFPDEIMNESWRPESNPAAACRSFRMEKLRRLKLGSLRESGFDEDDVQLLGDIGKQIAIAVENAIAYREISALKAQLQEENIYLQEEIHQQHNFKEIIGGSPALKNVLRQVETVASTDSTVLILGETGTGKELIARAIHSLSARRERTLVKLNCAAIPTGLLESELFGHEKGAFTGSHDQRIGRFELAHKGALFLDEIGDIPLDLQPKLLRVLQEQEFERLGSARTRRSTSASSPPPMPTSNNSSPTRSSVQTSTIVLTFSHHLPAATRATRRHPSTWPLVHPEVRFADAQADLSIPARTLAALAEYHWPGNSAN